MSNDQYKVVMTFNDIPSILEFVRINLQSIDNKTLNSDSESLNKFIMEWTGSYSYMTHPSFKENKKRLESHFSFYKKSLYTLIQNLENIEQLLDSLTKLKHPELNHPSEIDDKEDLKKSE